ncbi:MAG: PilZ domain-containing protein [Candidatus Xenobium sp.]|jgi:hypothetical protein|nr:PilZ domain-containing protein [Burkholderiales bacterium]
MSRTDLAGILRRNSIRKGWREPVRMPVRVLEPGGAAHDCELVEASPLGFRLRAPRRLPRNQRLVFRFLCSATDTTSEGLPGGVIDIPGEVLWTRKEGSGPLNVQSGGRFSLDHRSHWESLCRLLLHGPGIDMADLDERRSHGRMVHNQDLDGQDMVLRDISRGGAGLLVRQPVMVGSWLDLLLERGEEPLQLRGRVLRCQEIVRGSVYHVGLAFGMMDAETSQDLLTYLTELLEKKVPSSGPPTG